MAKNATAGEWLRIERAAFLGFAMAFTISCASGDNGESKPNSSSGAGSSSSNATPCTAADNTETDYCSNGIVKKYGSVTDAKGNVYKTIVIGEQTWMAENLNYAVEGSKCYGEGSIVYDYKSENHITLTLADAEIQANCAKYGRLYDWATANTVCPSGWHLPSQEEWKALTDYVQSTNNCTRCDAEHLKAASGWSFRYLNMSFDCAPSGSDSPYLCNDTHGFSALPGGFRDSDGNFRPVINGTASLELPGGEIGSWWAATEYNDNQAYGRFMEYEIALADWRYSLKASLFSVRCIKNMGTI